MLKLVAFKRERDQGMRSHHLYEVRSGNAPGSQGRWPRGRFLPALAPGTGTVSRQGALWGCTAVAGGTRVLSLSLRPSACWDCCPAGCLVAQAREEAAMASPLWAWSPPPPNVVLPPVSASLHPRLLY